MSDQRSDNSGFTLMEILAATAMVAVLAGTLYASLHIAFKAKRSAEAAVGTVRKGNLSLELLSTDLKSAVIPSGVLAAEFIAGRTAGAWGEGSDALTFYATAADVEPNNGIGDIKKIEYFCQDSQESGTRLLVRRVTTNLLAPVAVEGMTEVICRGVRTFNLRFFDGTTWTEEWDSTTQDNRLPVAVEVTVSLSEKSETLAGSDDDIATFRRVVAIPCGRPADANESAGGTL